MTASDSRETGLQGWLIVGVCFLALAVSFSARSILGLTMPLWESELGWSRGFISTGGALALVVMAAVAPFTGNFVDRLGPRPVLTVGLVVITAGMALLAMTQSQVQFILVYSVVAGLGFGIVASHVASTVVALHFVENRGLATGIATAGATSGQLIIIPLLAVVLTALGWRLSYAALGAAALALVPVTLLLIRARKRPAVARVARESSEPLRTRLGFLARSPIFHALFWSYVVCGFTTTGVIETHLLPYAAACGFPPLQGAAAYGVLSAFNLAGMLAAGWLTDRIHRPFLLTAIYTVRGLSFLLLMQIVGDLNTLFLFAVIFGLADYSTIPPTASLVASNMGLRIMGLSMGILAAGHAAGGALGAFLGGYLFDLFAAYDWVWYLSVALALIAALLSLTIRDPGRRWRPVPAVA
ncbi:MAG: MFS transporter [Alphaproteobacteria bacterium]